MQNRTDKALKELVRKVNSVISDSPKDNYDKQIMEKNVVTMLDLEREISNDVSDLLRLKKEIISVIKCIDNPEHKTLDIFVSISGMILHC